ncbi:MAG: FAD-dependent monooxygenase [Cyanobacteria bacterium REEB67]|nr:FAD-dependent monooxygenase [Cyanobacteria bacterium REEB67]
MSDVVEKRGALIVGAGPVGLTMACELLRRGVPFRLIDKATEPTDKSKALAIHSRTLEMLESMGMVEQFLQAGHIVYGTNFYNHSKKLLHLSFDEIDGPYPYALMIPQCETERLLREYLLAQGLAVERGVELSAFRLKGDLAEVTLKHEDGREEQASYDWLLGCDGAHSAVRHTLGLKFEGEQYAEGFSTFDVHVHWDKPDDELSIFVSDDGMMAFFPLGNNRYRVIADAPVGNHKTGDPITLAEAQKVVDERGPGHVTLSDPVWMTWFTINRRSAAKYSLGRAFLVGDAAHIHSPALGQGMNTGMQDAFNLAWKLALVDKGLSRPELLDSYQAERHPVGQALLKITDVVTRVATLRGALASGIRNRMIPLLAGHEVVQHRALKTLSMLGVNYRHSAIVGEYHGAAKTGGKRGALTKIGAWLEFAHGPLPGDRAPDGYVCSVPDGELLRLFLAIANGQHNLLLFAGLQADAASIDRLDQAANLIDDKYSGLIKPHFIVAGEVALSGLKPGVEVLFDTDQSLHHTYGAAEACLYLIRPDGYISYRSEPVDVPHLVAHLGLIFNKI